jgi:glycosyltransferase involved in cell wall biosynthesis
VKIIILGPAYPLRGGLASFAERMAYQLQSEGHEVEIVTFKLQYPSILFPGKTQFSSDPAPKDLKIHVWVNSIQPLNWVRVGNRIRKMNADLVICKYWLPFMGPCLGTILRQVKKNRKTHIMALAHNIIPHEKRIGDVPLTKYFVQPVDSFLTLSKSVAEEVKEFSKQPTAFTPHPIYDSYGELVDKEEGRKFLKIDENGRYALFFGFVRKYKGLDLLLRAMADKRIEKLGVKAIVAGEYYDNKETYDALIKELGISNRVIVKDDFIPNDEVRYYFGASDLVVQPYRTATQSGISQLAFYFEKPMVVTNVGGLPEIVGDNGAGYVVDVDPDAIADAIVNFYKRKKEAKLVEKVKESKKLFSWEVFTQVIYDLI